MSDYSQFENKMKKTCESLSTQLATLRAGRANAAVLDQIQVDYYGSPTPIQQVASVAVSEARTLTITDNGIGMTAEDLERNLEGFAQSVKQVMKEAHRGMLSGVCGPVSQLLKTPREYAVALETALGASMQHVVVETEQDAKNAIRLLKQRDWGRATFLPLSTIRGRRLQENGLDWK